MKNEDTITPSYVFIADIRESSQRHPEESKLNWVMRWSRGAEKEKREGQKNQEMIVQKGCIYIGKGGGSPASGREVFNVGGGVRGAGGATALSDSSWVSLGLEITFCST